MPTQAEIDAQLTEARQALHDLVTGNKAVKLKRQGREVEYQPTDVQALKSHIADLMGQSTATTQSRRRPASFF